MAVLPRPANPRALLADLRRIAGQGARREKLLAAVVAVGMTSLIITGFIVEARHGVLPEGEQISYASDWANSRSDAEIVAQQKIDQAAKAKVDAERRREFQRLEASLKKMGM